MRITLKKKDLLRADPPSPSYTPTRGPLRSKALRSKLPQLPSVAFTAYGRTYKQDSYLPPRPPQSSTAVEETFSSDPSGPIVDDENPMLDHPPSPTTTRHQPLEKINIVVCQCTPAHGAPQQLLEAGYFACAPLLPSLAVSLKVLDFVSELFLHMAPNNTAWCKATERFLDRMGYKLPTEGSLRKRFGNALVWYNSLKDQVANCVQSSIARARQSLLNLDDGVDISNEFEGDDPFSSPIGRLFDLPLADEHTEDPPVDDDVQTEDDELSGDGAEAQQGQEGNPFADALPRVRPSDYLRSCCPLCFGGLLFQNKRPSSADPCHAIVFTHVPYSFQKKM
ncbi:hypothetical protein H0H92_008315 [Tricholoma furcatifolium]|nr:hypothetical protein H0H92_007236 [Tricholoma furcatifolium]KAG6823996.1 hypothetical protein H0H92_008315 [Tricholoma furcatifolium]